MEVLTSTDYDEIAGHVAQHAPDAYELREITAQLDQDLHTVWLDGDNTVWHAWVTPGETVWHLDHESATEALVWLRQQLEGNGVFDRLGNPSRYNDSIERRYLASDEQAMSEFYDVELAAIDAALTAARTETPDQDTDQTSRPRLHRAHREVSARDVDRVARARIDQARQEAARLAGLRAHFIRSRLRPRFEEEGGRGWKSAAARVLGITPVTVGDILAADDARAARRRQAADDARDA